MKSMPKAHNYNDNRNFIKNNYDVQGTPLNTRKNIAYIKESSQNTQRISTTNINIDDNLEDSELMYAAKHQKFQQSSHKPIHTKK
jgi:hypothetical protein